MIQQIASACRYDLLDSDNHLALETSCDETAVAILRGSDDRSGTNCLPAKSLRKSPRMKNIGGVVPEIASRNHLVYAPRLLDRATRAAKIDLSEVDAFAATSGPGLASSLMIGASIAKGLAIGFGKPYLAINHLEGHLLSPFFRAVSADSRFGASAWKPHRHRFADRERLATRCRSSCRGLGDYQLIGRTVDDAAGEAFDKVAKMLGLGYPGGPEIEKRARGGDPNRFDFPRSMLDSENFSFSGLKTAVRYLLPKCLRAERRSDTDALTIWMSGCSADLCASFQQAIVDVLVRKDDRGSAEIRCRSRDGERRSELQSGIATAIARSMRSQRI